MIMAWIIGLFLSLSGIWFLKNSRHIRSWRYSKGEQPVLKVWILILLVIGSVIPVLNIVEGVAVIVWWIAETYLGGHWEFIQKNNKVVKFLNKPIG